MKSFMPLLLNLENKKIIIFGGGKVGFRKAKIFFKFSNITVISKEFINDFNELNVKKIKKEITKEVISNYIKDAFIVIPATDNYEINEMITEISKMQKKLVNRVDEKIEDLIVPSIIFKDDLTIAISTSGKSPMLSKFLRKEIENFLSVEHFLMLKLQTKLRDYLKKNINNQKEREKILRDIIKDKEIWGLLKDARFKDAYQLAEMKVNKCFQKQG